MSSTIPVKSKNELAQLVACAHQLPRDVRGEFAYEPEIDDLYYLYCTVRETACISVLEFGSGWSTFALSQALLENRSMLARKYSVRHPNPFELMTIDASSEWQALAVERLTPDQRSLVRSIHTTPRLYDFGGALATLYDSIPPFVPDLIYLDGPDPEQVEGSIAGFQLIEKHGLPMSADLLRLESHLWPGTTIITDGRTANARFLNKRFTRMWDSLHDPFGDRTVFRLAETTYGQVGEMHLSFRLQAARGLRQKEGPTP